jgi:predicted dehydrogenase
MADPLRMIVVGAGRGRSHLRSFLALPEQYEVVGLVDMDPERLKEALGSFDLPESLGYTSYDEALAQSGCDGVMVATWARTHEVLIEQALAADKHILVEKPFANTLAAAKKLLHAAEARGLKIAVTQQWRYLPGQRTVRRLMAAGDFGAPQTGHMYSYKSRGSEYPDSPYSQIWQMTVHEVDSLISMMGQPVVEVYGHAYHPPATTWKRESTATLEMVFENGCHIVMVSTSDSRVNGVEFRVECEHAALVYRNDKSFGSKEKIFVGKDREVGLQSVPVDEGPQETELLDQRVAESFAVWLNGGPEPETSGRNNLQVLGVLDGLIQSGETGAPVRVDIS